MNTTTNLGLKKPEYSDQADIGDINDNMDTIDAKLGAVGNTSLQGQMDAVNTTIGSTALPTTAQTLTGAVAELKTDIDTKTQIDDTAGAGDTNKTWSADKLSGIGVPTLISDDDYEIAL